MKILALDLGTNTGFALEADDYPLSCGTKNLGNSGEIIAGACDMRFFTLLGFIDGICLGCKPDLIVYEDVQFCKSRIQAHLWATWRAAVWLMAWKHQVEIACCPTGTLKKFATGKGSADKAEMAKYLAQNPRFIDKTVPIIKKKTSKKTKQEFNVQVLDRSTGAMLDDNAVDALHLLRWAKSRP